MSSPAQILIHTRRLLGLTQADFAQKLGKSQGTIARYERGQINPPADVFIRAQNMAAKEPITVEDLVHDIRNRLGGENDGEMRAALSRIIAGLATR